jgi:hypothetical protein
MRSAPQRQFSRDIRSISSIVSLANDDRRAVPDLDFRFKKGRNPPRCQRTIVSGFTRRTVSRYPRTMLDSNTIKPRSVDGRH